MTPGWLTATEAGVPAGDSWLSPVEQAVAAALRMPGRRRDWRLGRWTAKLAVGAALGVEPAAVEILAAPGGAPQARLGGAAAPVSVSISHRSGVAVCLVAGPDSQTGVDLELVEPRARAFARDFFTAEELAMADRTDAADHDLVVTLAWSAKESALKALGEGLRLDTRSVAVSLDLAAPPHLGWQPLAVRHGARTFAGWWRRLDGLVLTAIAEPAGQPPVRLTRAAVP